MVGLQGSTAFQGTLRNIDLQCIQKNQLHYRNDMITMVFISSWYNSEVEKSRQLNEYLGAGIGIFQGLSNLAINGMTLIVLYSGGVLLDSKQITAGELMSFLMATQTIQR